MRGHEVVPTLQFSLKQLFVCTTAIALVVVLGMPAYKAYLNRDDQTRANIMILAAAPIPLAPVAFGVAGYAIARRGSWEQRTPQ